MFFAKKQGLRKAQTPLEILGVSVVLIGLLLVVLLATYTRNAQTEEMLTIGENSILCQEVSSAIASVYSNRATVKETLSLTNEVLFERASSSRTGIMTIGSVSCSYISPVQLNTGEKDTDFGGLPLGIGNWCFENLDHDVLVTEGVCT